MRKEYVDRLIRMMPEAGFDAVLIQPGEELQFLFGASPMMCERFQGMIIRADGKMFYFCNLLYEGQMREYLPDDIAIYTWFDNDDMTDVVSRIFKEQGLEGATVGVNASAQAFNVLDLADAMNIRFRSAKALIEEIRIHKTPDEMQALRDSAAITDRVFTEILPKIHPGVTEAELQDFLLTRMAELGGKSPECIVGIGANASYPHYIDNKGVAGDRDIVLMDYGCTYNGLYSDMTRTVFIGEPEERIREAYDLVLRANLAAEDMVKPGAWVPDLDKKAREVLDEKGYAHTLINRLGHGVGYTIHEQPEIKQSDRRKLEPGMAFSIEPGIYMTGDFGIRIEDVVMINELGEREVLNHSDKNMIVL